MTGATDRCDRLFVAAIIGCTLVGLAIRLVYGLGAHHGYEPLGDPFFYHHGANLLADGGGFKQPYLLAVAGRAVEAADHPPLYMTILASASFVGLRSVTEHLVLSSLMGAATIPVAALLGRRVGGRRVGVLAAALVAVAPQVWLYDGMLLSESLAILLATLAVLLAYRAAEQPDLRRFTALGLVIGAAALTRAELALLVPLLAWPVAACAR
ncbi:MAG: glycosyltransferase family 39 protein, partial [Actinomycetota bacterium]